MAKYMITGAIFCQKIDTEDIELYFFVIFVLYLT